MVGPLPGICAGGGPKLIRQLASRVKGLFYRDPWKTDFARSTTARVICIPNVSSPSEWLAKPDHSGAQTPLSRVTRSPFHCLHLKRRLASRPPKALCACVSLGKSRGLRLG